MSGKLTDGRDAYLRCEHCSTVDALCPLWACLLSLLQSADKINSIRTQAANIIFSDQQVYNYIKTSLQAS